MKPYIVGCLMCITILSESCFDTHERFEPATEEKIDNNGVIIEKPPVWVVSLSPDSITIGSFIDPVVYEKTVVTNTNNGSKEDWFLVGLDTENGSEQWRWNDYVVNDLWYGKPTSQNGSYFLKKRSNASTNGGMSVYAIDSRDGSTHSINTKGRTLEAQVITHKDYVYTSFFDVNGADSSFFPTIYSINIATGQMDSLTTPPIRKLHFDKYQKLYGSTNGLHAFTGKGGDDYMIIPYSEREAAQDSYGTIYVSLYNITKRTYEYTEKLLTTSAVSFMRPTVIYKESIVILNSNEILFGVDLYTGDIIWKKSYRDGVFSMIIEDNVLVAAQVLGSDTKTFGINPMTGTEFWSIPSGGGASTLKALNGIVYWKDRGDGDLYAVEALTGTKIWQLDDPDPESDSWWRSDAVGILPGENGEKGKIFASSHRRMYCFEAAR
jgi:outer membrane protein assembly factor BamB